MPVPGALGDKLEGDWLFCRRIVRPFFGLRSAKVPVPGGLGDKLEGDWLFCRRIVRPFFGLRSAKDKESRVRH